MPQSTSTLSSNLSDHIYTAHIKQALYKVQTETLGFSSSDVAQYLCDNGCLLCGIKDNASFMKLIHQHYNTEWVSAAKLYQLSTCITYFSTILQPYMTVG